MSHDMLSPSAAAAAVDTARAYYNSSDADTFYSGIWGGQDIHIGLYQDRAGADTIAQASVRTVDRIADSIPTRHMLAPQARVLDLGAGYGGPARRLARTCGFAVTCLNLSEVENERNRQLTRADGLEHLISVIDASFESVPLPDKSFDVVWSQDALLHAGDRMKVVAEMTRLVRDDGSIVFSDPMMASEADERKLEPVRRRLNLVSLGSVREYERQFATHGFLLSRFDDLTGHMETHYSRVLAELNDRESELRQSVSTEYIEKMKVGLSNWIEFCREGQLQWGILSFVKARPERVSGKSPLERGSSVSLRQEGRNDMPFESC